MGVFARTSVIIRIKKFEVMRLEALLGFTAVESTTEKEAINYVHTWGISTHCLNLPDYEENHQIALR